MDCLTSKATDCGPTVADLRLGGKGARVGPIGYIDRACRATDFIGGSRQTVSPEYSIGTGRHIGRADGEPITHRELPPGNGEAHALITSGGTLQEYAAFRQRLDDRDLAVLPPHAGVHFQGCALRSGEKQRMASNRYRL